MSTIPGAPHRLHCILPPHLLRALAENGTPDEREVALAALADADGPEGYRQRRRLRRRARRQGLIARALPASATRQLKICDAHHSTSLPGSTVRLEGAPATGDAAADEAYDGMGATWDLYAQVFDRDSYDNEGAELVGSVHYRNNYDNAFWDGTQMAYGDGDGKYFNRFTVSIDIMGHELTHAVTNSESNLAYDGQSGALNESISDVFGSLVKQHAASPQQTADEADWLIGSGLFTSRVHGDALRNMAEPGTAYDDPVLGKDPQPGHMDDYVNTSDDNGGVHINSGIPSKAFVLFAKALGGHAWERAGQVWYATCVDDTMPETCTFQQFADLTASHAASVDADVAGALADAWSQVGITVAAPTGSGDPDPAPSPTPGPTPSPDPSPSPEPNPDPSPGAALDVSHIDLTEASGAPLANGDPAAYSTGDGRQHVVYRDDAGHLHELSWTEPTS